MFSQDPSGSVLDVTHWSNHDPQPPIDRIYPYGPSARHDDFERCMRVPVRGRRKDAAEFHHARGRSGGNQMGPGVPPGRYSAGFSRAPRAAVSGGAPQWRSGTAVEMMGTKWQVSKNSRAARPPDRAPTQTQPLANQAVPGSTHWCENLMAAGRSSKSRAVQGQSIAFEPWADHSRCAASSPRTQQRQSRRSAPASRQSGPAYAVRRTSSPVNRSGSGRAGWPASKAVETITRADLAELRHAFMGNLQSPQRWDRVAYTARQK